MEYTKETFKENALRVMLLMCSLFAGVAIQFGAKKYNYPYTVGCFLFGVLLGLIEIYSPFEELKFVPKMNPRDMLLTFLPVLIFESSFGMDAHIFYKALPQCLVLAVLGFLFCTVLTAVFAVFALQTYGWSWLTALVFGSIISATDPVAVVALLKEMKMPHTFTVLIEGESLLNDGVAIVLYEMFTEYIVLNKPFEIGATIIELIKTCIGAPTFGYVLGKITEWILIRIYISPISEMTVTLVLAYVTYFIAEKALGVSAILAVVLYGVTLSANKMCISPESESLIHTDWRLLSIYGNALIFMIVGLHITSSLSEEFSPMDAWLILMTYLVLTFLRGLMVALLYPILKRTGYGLNWKESIILSWGGLRGAIGLALSLMLTLNTHLPSTVNAEKVLVQVSGIIILTLIVNANTITYVMKVIRFKKITLVNRLSMGHAISCITEIKEKSLRICKRDWKFMKADWKWLIRYTKLHDPYKGGLHGEDPNMASLFVPYGTCNVCSAEILPYLPNVDEMDELKEAARKRVLRALQGSLWKQFRRGLIQRRSLKLLSVAADNASDTPYMYLKTEDIKAKFMRVSRLNHWLEINLSHLIKRLKVKKNTNADFKICHLKKSHFGAFRNCCIWIYFTIWLEPLIYAVIFFNIIHISFDIYFIHSENQNVKEIMDSLAVFFILFYTLEIFIKISALSWSLYMQLFWNKLDFTVTILAVLEGILDVILSQYPSLHTVATHIRILIILRTLKYFYFVVARCTQSQNFPQFLILFEVYVGFKTSLNIFRNILSVIRNHASSELYYVYDTGQGFLFASNSVLKNIDMIVDFGPCAKVPISICEKNIREMLDTLDEFEKNYPAIALALKSNRAARRILNRVEVVLDSLKNKSLIVREDARELKLVLFKMTKEVVFAPRYRPFTGNIKKILEEVDWIKPELADYIYENHILVTYDAGDVIQEAELLHQFVFIIAKGIVKIICQEDSEQESCFEMYNKLPNADSLLYFKDGKNKHFNDYLMTSQTIGLLGFLQKIPSVTSAVCEKECELIQIDYSFLDEAQEHFDDLLFCMWRSISIKIAVQLLRNQKRYQTFENEDINLRLQKSILPNLSKVTYLEVPSVVEDMVIIQGRMKDLVNKIEFVPPSYIPSTSRLLKMLDDTSGRSPIILLMLLDKSYYQHHTNWITLEELNNICSLN